MLTYGPNGVSRGIATIIFSKPGGASDALVKLNGMLVDKKPMKARHLRLPRLTIRLTPYQIEVVLDATRAPPPPPIKGLSDRIA